MFFKDTNDVVSHQNDEVVAENSAEKSSQKVSEKELASQELASQERAQQELAQCKLEVTLWKEQYIRARADFENYTKRAEKERSNLVLFSQTQILLDLIAVVDDFDRALEQENKDAAEDVVAWRSGIAMIRASLGKLLETYGVKPMTDYGVFNPELHEAISQVVVEGKASGTIVHVAQKGYLRNGVVLRAAKVVVAQ